MHQGKFDDTHVSGSVQLAGDCVRDVGNGVSAIAQLPHQCSGPVQHMETLASLIVHHHLVAVTETRTPAEVDLMASVLQEVAR